jgi:hypothetical protein
MKKLCFVALTGLMLIGCGGSDGGSPPPSIDRSKKVAAFTDQDREDFCAWDVAKLGGEGHVTDCGGGNHATAPKVSDCTTGLKQVPTNCAATYGDMVDCIDAQAGNVCSPDWLNNPGCKNVFNCGMSM